MEATKLGVPRKVGKRIRHGVSYGMGGKTLAEYFNLSLTEALTLRKAFWDNHPESRAFKPQLDSADGFETPLLGRWVRFDKPHAKLNCVIQGSCVELLWVALYYLYQQSNRVKVLPHFHDEIVLKCLKCHSHELGKVCQSMLGIKQEIENLFPFTWPGTQVKVFELGVK